MALPPACCRQVMLARRKECGPSPGKSQPSACAAWCKAARTRESRSCFDGSRLWKKTLGVRCGTVFGYLGLEVERGKPAYSPPQTAWMGAYRYSGRGIDLGCLSICWLVTPPP